MRRTRILVVDDSVVARRVISEILSEEDGFEVIGTAPNGRLALTKIGRQNPDVVTLDIDMPELDGIETLTRIRSDHPTVRVIMASNLTLRGASITVEALFLGASDYVTKASRSSSPEEAKQYLRNQLVPKIRALMPRPVARRPEASSIGYTTKGRRASPHPVEVVVIGASTGGPNALTSILESLPEDFPVPVLIVQHLPENFTTFLANRLDAACTLPVREARGGNLLQPGAVWIAPGNLHLETRSTSRGVQLATSDGPLINSCRPAADILFRTAAGCFGASTLGVVLTGMGQDGLEGSRSIRNAGGRIVAQNKDTSVVWGMPGQVTEAGLADMVLPISDIGPEIVRLVQASRR